LLKRKIKLESSNEQMKQEISDLREYTEDKILGKTEKRRESYERLE